VGRILSPRLLQVTVRFHLIFCGLRGSDISIDAGVPTLWEALRAVLVWEAQFLRHPPVPALESETLSPVGFKQRCMISPENLCRPVRTRNLIDDNLLRLGDR